jgi:hypothetical protein
MPVLRLQPKLVTSVTSASLNSALDKSSLNNPAKFHFKNIT